MEIVTNIASMKAQQNLNKISNRQEATFNRISSGMRINSSADDAAGLGISESLNLQITSYNQAVLNGNDGVGMVQTADAALGQIGDLISRGRALAMQSANGSLSDSPDRTNISVEFNQIANEINRIQNDTQYNGQNIISADNTTTLQYQVGITGNETSQIAANFNGLDLSEFAAPDGSVSNLDVSTQANAQGALATLDNLMQTLTSYRASLGAVSNRLESAVTSASTMSISLSASLSQLRDADISQESSNMARDQVLAQASLAALSKANQSPESVLTLLR